jgi:hypothetical protein
VQRKRFITPDADALAYLDEFPIPRVLVGNVEHDRQAPVAPGDWLGTIAAAQLSHGLPLRRSIVPSSRQIVRRGIHAACVSEKLGAGMGSI